MDSRESGGWTVVRPTSDHAALVAGWPASADEAEIWCSRGEHPFPAEAVTSWWEADDVSPWLLLDPDGVPVAYGEVWDDAEEDENELARLIVDPARRRQGVGRRLVEELVDIARTTGRSACFIRVAPRNAGALALYRAAGFRDVDETVAAGWNQGQPVDYRWLEHPGFPAATST